MNYCKDNQNNVFAYSDIQTQKTVDGWQYSLNGMLNLVQYLIKNLKYARRKNVISK